MRKAALVVCATVVVAAPLLWAFEGLGADDPWFAFLVVWLPMVWLGTVSHVVTPRLPERYHALHGFELDGHVYELLGIRVVKRLLRRGPLAVFNPRLHLPTDPTPERLGELDQRMRDAEATHAILFLLTFGIVVNAAVRGWWVAAGLTLLFDILINGYPVMLQRYNRALLRRRFDRSPTD